MENPQRKRDYDNAHHHSKKNDPHYQRVRASHRLKVRYDITLDDFEAMTETQDGKCLLCGRVPKRLVVDHCHATSRVRGLLCDGCNVGLGHIEKEGWLSAALSYLEKM